MVLMNSFQYRKKKLKISELKKILKQNRNLNQKKQALLLLAIRSFVTPTRDGHSILTTFTGYVKELDKVNNYAWGAAALAFLCRGIQKSYIGGGKKNTIDGNLWLIACFFLIPIPKLGEAIKLNLNLESCKVPLVSSVVEKTRKAGFDHHEKKFKEHFESVLENLTDEDIQWRPYSESMFQNYYEPLRRQLRFTTLVSPLFCESNVVHHLPYLVPKQFPLFEGLNLELIPKPHKINLKGDSGPFDQDWREIYAVEIALWDKRERRLVHHLVDPNSVDSHIENGPNRENGHPVGTNDTGFESGNQSGVNTNEEENASRDNQNLGGSYTSNGPNRSHNNGDNPVNGHPTFTANNGNQNPVETNDAVQEEIASEDDQNGEGSDGKNLSEGFENDVEENASGDGSGGCENDAQLNREGGRLRSRSNIVQPQRFSHSKFNSDTRKRKRDSCEMCGKSQGPRRNWVRCDICGRWLHCKCVNITRAEANSMEQFVCTYCRKEKDGEEENTPCGVCGEKGDVDSWIGCETCDEWFHYNCVNITEAKAKRISQYKCTACSQKTVTSWKYRFLLTELCNVYSLFFHLLLFKHMAITMYVLDISRMRQGLGARKTSFAVQLYPKSLLGSRVLKLFPSKAVTEFPTCLPNIVLGSLFNHPFC